MVQHGATWCNMLQHGAKLCKMVQDGARKFKMIHSSDSVFVKILDIGYYQEVIMYLQNRNSLELCMIPFGSI